MNKNTAHNHQKPDKFHKARASLSNLIFVKTFILKNILVKQKKLRIAFGQKPVWENTIRKSLRYSNHEISFVDMSNISQNDYDLIIPFNFKDLKDLETKQIDCSGNLIPTPSLRSYSLLSNKQSFMAELEKIGFGQHNPNFISTNNYPYILKKNTGVNGKDCHIILSDKDEQQHHENINSPDYHKQSFIPGFFEYATHLVVKNGRPLYALNIKYAFNTPYPIKGNNKDKVVYIEICECPHIELLCSILEKLGFNGLCCVNYKELDGHLYLLEINPRCGRSMTPHFGHLIQTLQSRY